MSRLLLAAVSAAIVNNIILGRQVGVCPLVQAAGSLRRLLRLGLVITAVMTAGAAAGGMVNAWVLGPLKAGPLMILANALGVLFLSRLATWTAVRTGWLPAAPGTVEELVLSAQCVTLAVVLLGTELRPGPAGLALGFGSGLGWTGIAVVFEMVRRRLDEAPVPAAMKGLPVYLVVLGLMALAAMGLDGLAAND